MTQITAKWGKQTPQAGIECGMDPEKLYQKVDEELGENPGVTINEPETIENTGETPGRNDLLPVLPFTPADQSGVPQAMVGQPQGKSTKNSLTEYVDDGVGGRSSHLSPFRLTPGDCGQTDS